MLIFRFFFLILFFVSLSERVIFANFRSYFYRNVCTIYGVCFWYFGCASTIVFTISCCVCVCVCVCCICDVLRINFYWTWLKLRGFKVSQSFAQNFLLRWKYVSMLYVWVLFVSKTVCRANNGFTHCLVYVDVFILILFMWFLVVVCKFFFFWISSLAFGCVFCVCVCFSCILIDLNE